MGRTPVDQSQWVTPAEAAELLGVVATTVSDWARKGILPSFTTPGGHRRFRRSEIERVLAEGFDVPADPQAAS